MEASEAEADAPVPGKVSEVPEELREQARWLPEPHVSHEVEDPEVKSRYR